MYSHIYIYIYSFYVYAHIMHILFNSWIMWPWKSDPDWVKPTDMQDLGSSKRSYAPEAVRVRQHTGRLGVLRQPQRGCRGRRGSLGLRSAPWYFEWQRELASFCVFLFVISTLKSSLAQASAVNYYALSASTESYVFLAAAAASATAADPIAVYSAAVTAYSSSVVTPNSQSTYLTP